MLYFIKMPWLTNEIFVPLYDALVRPHPEYAVQENCPHVKRGISHLERIQWTAAMWVKRLRDLNQEERLKALDKRRIRNNLVLTHEITYNQINLEATQLIKFSRRPGLRRSSLTLLQKTGRIQRRMSSFACRVVKYSILYHLQ